MYKPPVHRGMKELDRAAFSLTIPVVALRVPTKTVGRIKAEISSDILKVPKLRNVVNDSKSNEFKILLLDSAISSTDLTGASEKLHNLVKQDKLEAVNHQVILDYEHWSADEILKAVLPDSNEAPTSYEQIGHIAHMNLRDQYLEYKTLIGQVILDKSPTVATVVNKLDTIDNTFRNFKMEVLAGKDDFMAQVRENDCVFKFDYSKVYWNSRLHSEHERLIKKFSIGSSICDVMAGVGPFAVPAAKRGCLVWANDLNPASYDAMQENIVLNKVQDRVCAFNMDGRDFIRKAFVEYFAKTKQGPLSIPPIPKASVSRSKPVAPEPPIEIPSRSFDHVVMNLPAIAIEFLDAFRGLFAGFEEKPNLPLIHTHCFTKSDEPEKDILQRACRAMGYPEEQYEDLDADVYYVRRVAPKKDMYCLSLRLPEAVAYASETGSKRKLDQESAESINQNKVRLSDNEDC
ncbi:tRNA(m(1)G37)methyltransferase [Coemansia sp. RSA 1722]|nr:tRNA(m(1)G37)methyltransferase [Coemansia sp. RSA 486]KAJ2234172.1 tRNA(m(1)G37)methyltransferase [Coemansia sp. RSA 485]KAJ2602521.1 tRNA(m(1)G37)methyltransferase [Coemansia sp. RSA 1722]